MSLQLTILTVFKLTLRLIVYLLSITFMAGVLGILIDSSYRIMVLLNYYDIYNKMVNNFGYRFSYSQTIAVFSSILFIPLMKKIANAPITSRFLTKKLKMTIVFLVLLIIIELSTRYIIYNSDDVKIEVKRKLNETAWYFWIMSAILSFIITFILKMCIRFIDSLMLNIHSTQLYKKILNGKIVKFSLYLRPFEIDNKLSYDNEESVASYYPFSSDLVMKEFSSNFENELATQLKYKYPLIGLGKDNLSNSGRISTSDNEWKNIFNSLVEKATFVFLIPAINEGTFFEMSCVAKNEKLLKKTFFILPPKKNSTYDVKKWEEILLKCEKEIGICFPKFSEYGYYFQIDKEGNNLDISSITEQTFTNNFDIKFEFRLPSTINNKI